MIHLYTTRAHNLNFGYMFFYFFLDVINKEIIQANSRTKVVYIHNLDCTLTDITSNKYIKIHPKYNDKYIIAQSGRISEDSMNEHIRNVIANLLVISNDLL